MLTLSLGRLLPSIAISSVCSALALSPGGAQAQTAAPGYKLSVFAGPLSGSSAPDSIAVVGSDVFVGYGNGGAPDGSGGAMSTIAEYNGSGALLRSLSVAGHNDGLRYDPSTGKLWALQNEDGNSTLAFVNPKTFTITTPIPFLSFPHGGGYDDVAFGAGGTAYVSASNPAHNPNLAPAIVSASVGAGGVAVSGVLNGNASASVINRGGATTLNLQDPDSLIFAPNGQLVMTSQADEELVFVSNVGTPGQSASVLRLFAANGCPPLTGNCTVDDTVFGKGGRQQLLFADTNSGNVYSLVGDFGAGLAYSAADSLSEIVNVNLSSGVFTPLATGLDAPHGEAFTGVIPEPSTWAMMLIGFAGLGLAACRRAKAAVSVAA